MIKFKSKALLTFECYFHIYCDSINQIPLGFYIILVLNTLLRTIWKTTIWDSTLPPNPSDDILHFAH